MPFQNKGLNQVSEDTFGFLEAKSICIQIDLLDCYATFLCMVRCNTRTRVLLSHCYRRHILPLNWALSYLAGYCSVQFAENPPLKSISGEKVRHCYTCTMVRVMILGKQQ